MSFTQEEILALANSLGNSMPEEDTLSRYLTDAFLSSAKRLSILATLTAELILLESAAVDFFSGDFNPDDFAVLPIANYTYPNAAIAIIYALMHDSLLSPVSEKDLEAYAKTWQIATGTPICFTQDDLTARTYRLFPAPDFSSGALIPTHGEPFGEDYPENPLVLIYTDERTEDIPEFNALPHCCIALAKEFSRPSDHIDQQQADLFSQLASLFEFLLQKKE